MKRQLLITIFALCSLGFLPAATHFQKKANAYTPEKAGAIYEIGKGGIVVYEGKKKAQAGVGEKLSPRVVLISPKPLIIKGSDYKINANPASSHVYEIDLVKFEF